MTVDTLTRSSSSGSSSDGRGESQLNRLRAERRDPGEARFFYWENHFRRDAVRVLPGEYFVHDSDLVIMTTLGSCIAVCLTDPQMRVGGMNHFMLPEGGSGPGADHGRYGSYAMELLINGLMRRGAMRSRLQAKVFGGAGVIEGMTTINIGEKNTRFVLDYLQTEHIPVIAKDVLDVYPRKVCMMPASGKALVKRLPPTRSTELLKLEKEAARQIAPVESSGGSIDLF